MKLYWAAPLFSQQERTWNRGMVEHLKSTLPGWETLLPQDIKVQEQFNKKSHFGHIFRACVDYIDQSDLIVAVLDGADADSGVAWEMGYAHAKGIPVLGVRTDFRESQERGVNLMLSRSCTRMVTAPSFSEDDKQLAKLITRKIKDIFRRKKNS